MVLLTELDEGEDRGVRVRRSRGSTDPSEPLRAPTPRQWSKAISGYRLHLPTPVIPDIVDYGTLFWFMDCSKQAWAMFLQHFVNLFMAIFFAGFGTTRAGECIWYVTKQRDARYEPLSSSTQS